MEVARLKLTKSFYSYNPSSHCNRHNRRDCSNVVRPWAACDPAQPWASRSHLGVKSTAPWHLTACARTAPAPRPPSIRNEHAVVAPGPQHCAMRGLPHPPSYLSSPSAWPIHMHNLPRPRLTPSTARPRHYAPASCPPPHTTQHWNKPYPAFLPCTEPPPAPPPAPLLDPGWPLPPFHAGPSARLHAPNDERA